MIRMSYRVYYTFRDNVPNDLVVVFSEATDTHWSGRLYWNDMNMAVEHIPYGRITDSIAVLNGLVVKEGVEVGIEYKPLRIMA